MTTSPVLQIEGLQVALKKGAYLLRDIHLNVLPGEVRALVGESGAGKSMIGKAVLGVLPRGIEQVGGEIFLLGQNLTGVSAAQRRQAVARNVSLIPQDPMTALNPARRVGGQITDRLVLRLGWQPEAARQRALELLERVQIRQPQRVMTLYPHELSGGMRQRILIAAAFAPRPQLIVADEPTTALDVTVQKQILKLIRELQSEARTAVLFVTHDMGVVAKISQCVTVLFDGRIMEQATTPEIFAAPRHPYTRALIAATPRYDQPDANIQPIPPSLIAALRGESPASTLALQDEHSSPRESR